MLIPRILHTSSDVSVEGKDQTKCEQQRSHAHATSKTRTENWHQVETAGAWISDQIMPTGTTSLARSTHYCRKLTPKQNKQIVPRTNKYREEERGSQNGVGTARSEYQGP